MFSVTVKAASKILMPSIGIIVFKSKTPDSELSADLEKDACDKDIVSHSCGEKRKGLHV
jgi:hypothetical protein